MDDSNKEVNLCDFHWFNEPLYKTINKDSAIITSSPNSDFWKTSEENTKTGNFIYYNIEGNFKVSVCLKAKWKEQYDQGGIMLGEVNKDIWIKTGIEYTDNKKYISSVVTNKFSDWSVLPIENEDLYIEVQRINSEIFIKYSINNNNLTFFRHVTNFSCQSNIQVGLYVASPKNNDGIEVEFNNFNIIIYKQ